MQENIKKFDNGGKQKFQIFLNKYKGYKVYDLFEDLYVQYTVIKNPRYFNVAADRKEKLIQKIKKKLQKDRIFSYGSWVVLPSRSEIYHLLNQNDYLDFRTIRNRNLITYDEQKTLYNKKILFIGMSVGSQVLLTFVRMGIGNRLVLVDADNVEIHNMNRTNFFIQDIGNKKVEVMQSQVNSIDPYIDVDAVGEYVNDSNLKKLLEDVDLVVDSFDDFAMKIKLRKVAKRLKIPVLSGFDISRGAMVIAERYDTEKNLDLKFYLNGYTEEEILSVKQKGLREKTNVFIQIIGKKYHDKRMLDSVYEVGKKLTGYPQLSVATSLASSMWTVSAIDILLGKVRKSLRAYINLEEEVYK
jgi:hypothetical protein